MEAIDGKKENVHKRRREEIDAEPAGGAERRATERDEERLSPITVALVFPTIQSRREATSPKRNLNLEPATRRTIFAPTIFTKLFNDGEGGKEGYSCAVREALHVVVPN